MVLQKNLLPIDTSAAYFQMLGELFPYFLHDLNNPLTALQAYGYSYSAPSQADKKVAPDFLSELASVSAKLVKTSDYGGKLVQARGESYSSKLNTEIDALIKLMQIKFRRIQTTLAAGSQFFPADRLMPNREVLLLIYTVLEMFHRRIFSLNDKPECPSKTMNIKVSRSVEPFKLLFTTDIGAFPEKLQSVSTIDSPDTILQATFLPASSGAILQVATKFCHFAKIGFELSGDSNQKTLGLVF